MKKRIRSSLTKNHLYIIGFIIFYLITFITFKDKFLFTPDFGESDSYHLNFSLKYFLSKNLKKNHIPFWTDKLQGGMPLMAEGQIGGFFFLNILFLKFLPFYIGYNLLFISSLFLLSYGIYLFLKEIKTPQIIAFLLGLNFAWNGSISLRLVHLNLIQTFSLTPYLFLTLIKFVKTNNKFYLLFFSLILSQMIFAGHSQIVFISLLGTSLWFIFFLNHCYKGNLKKILTNTFLLLIFVIIGFFIAFPQILPTLTLTKYSLRPLQLSYWSATSFPFNFKNLIGFYSPFYYGNPRLGTYPPFSSNWGIFWENTPYLGKPLFFIFIITTALALLFYKKKFKTSLLFHTLFLSLIFLLLSLGRSSPLYFLYNFPPFNFFRTPSKYLLMVNYFLFIFLGLGLKEFTEKKSIRTIIIMIVLLLNLFDLLSFTKNYHLLVNKDDLLHQPQLAKKISPSLKYISLGQVYQWNKIFLDKGWQNEDSQNYFLFFKNYLFPNSNLIFNKKTFDINSGGHVLKRPEYLKRLITKDLVAENKTITVPSRTVKLLKILNIRYIITPYKIKNDRFKIVKKATRKKNHIYLYQLNTNFNDKDNFIYIPFKLKKINFLEDFQREYYKETDFQKTALIESIKMKINENRKPAKIFKIQAKNENLTVEGYFPQPSFLVVKKNYFPNWKVYINGKETKKYPVNLIHIGINVPKGKNKIEVRYSYNDFLTGILISFMTIIVTASLLFKYN